MSEYVTVEVDFAEDPDIADLLVNQVLTQADEELYASAQAGDEGSPLAQMLFAAVDGIKALTIAEDCLTITRDPAFPWETIIDEVRDVLRDWYL
ncbi:MAG: NifU N-terminal domain-containing protein [Chloroflexota bacterium]|nr:NifU N-terminal domain-containing protein [Chloroflexota bacterium]